MKKLRIAIFEPTRRLPGGGQKVMTAVASYLSIKHEVTVFTQAEKQGGMSYGNSKVKIIKPTNRYLSPFAFLFQKLNKNDWDLVIYGCYPATFAAIRNSEIPSIQIIHAPPRSFYDLRKQLLKTSNFKERLKIHIKNLFFKKLDYLGVQKINKILGISKEIKSRIKKYYNKDSEVLYPGIYPENYSSGKYGNYILAPGRIVLNKRPKTIVESMGFVKNKSIKLKIVGSGDMEEEIKTLAKKHKNVEVIGFVSENELKQLYSNCLAVIYIPINEDYGYVPVEAAASGKATLGSNEGGLRETVLNNKTGLLIDNITPEKLAEKIDFFANNKNIAIKMGKQAKIYSKNFTWSQAFNVLENKIKEVVKK